MQISSKVAEYMNQSRRSGTSTPVQVFQVDYLRLDARLLYLISGVNRISSFKVIGIILQVASMSVLKMSAPKDAKVELSPSSMYAYVCSFSPNLQMYEYVRDALQTAASQQKIKFNVRIYTREPRLDSIMMVAKTPNLFKMLHIV